MAIHIPMGELVAPRHYPARIAVEGIPCIPLFHRYWKTFSMRGCVVDKLEIGLGNKMNYSNYRKGAIDATIELALMDCHEHKNPITVAPDDLSEVLFWTSYIDEDDRGWAESDSFLVCKTKNGKIAVFHESGDSTGHG